MLRLADIRNSDDKRLFNDICRGEVLIGAEFLYRELLAQGAVGQRFHDNFRSAHLQDVGGLQGDHHSLLVFNDQVPQFPLARVVVLHPVVDFHVAPQMSLSGELVTTLRALKLPHTLVPANMDPQLLYGFESFSTDLAKVGPPLLVPTGDVSQQRALFREPLVAELTTEGPLACVGPVVLIQACLSAESLATEVALEGFLPSMGPQVHIEVGLLGKGMMAELADIGPLVPVLGLDVHLQAIATGGPVATLLTDKQLLSTVLESFMKAQLCPGQEALGAGGTRMWLGGSMQLNQVALQILFLHKLLDAGRALVRHLSCVGHHMQAQLHPPLEDLRAY